MNIKTPTHSADLELILIAIHKETNIEYRKPITYGEWVNFKRNKNYYYKTIVK